VPLLAGPGAIFFYAYSRANDMTQTTSHYIFSLSFRAHRVSKPDFALVVRILQNHENYCSGSSE